MIISDQLLERRGEIQFRIITADTGTPMIVKGIQRKISTNTYTNILLVCRGTTLDVIGKSIKVVSLHKKRPLFLKVFFWFYLIKCFLVSTVSVKPLLHTQTDYAIYCLFVEGEKGMLLNCHMCQFSLFGYMAIKKTP